ncbi:hypothetical protein ACWD04_20360 [Streptomyces sp. NPDC002911]
MAHGRPPAVPHRPSNLVDGRIAGVLAVTDPARLAGAALPDPG